MYLLKNDPINCVFCAYLNNHFNQNKYFQTVYVYRYDNSFMLNNID